MERLKDKIHKAEQKLLLPLYNNCKYLFEDKNISSHDHTHHMRVWEYSKTILDALNNIKDISYNTVESCLIASLFHDTGLSITPNKNHGRESRDICFNYFENSNLNKPENFEEILNSIEKHDDKEYKTKSQADSILSILSIADDLDAFGNIGVIRYTEIYLMRGISINELPKLVLENLDKRFLNFEKDFKIYPDLFTNHKSRYLITRKFFEELNKEIT